MSYVDVYMNMAYTLMDNLAFEYNDWFIDSECKKGYYPTLTITLHNYQYRGLETDLEFNELWNKIQFFSDNYIKYPYIYLNIHLHKLCLEHQI